MKYVMAILMLLILMVGCAPAGNKVVSPQPVPVVDNSSILTTRISTLESELATCQSTNMKLQKQIDISAGTYNAPSSKEPASGDSGVYYLQSDKIGLQYPNKYLTWDILGVDCTPFQQFTLNTSLTNSHPNLAMTNVTVNDEPVGSAGTISMINPGQTFTFTKTLPMPKVVDYQVVLRWVWQ